MSSQGKFYAALGAILVLGAAVIGYVVVRDRQLQTSFDPSSTALPEVAEGELVPATVGVSFGAGDAPVVIEEYADYQCPYCGMVATLTMPQIMETYVETGKARFVFYDFPLHPGASQLGAEAARCAGDQDAFWPMHKVLMGRMREWGAQRNPRSEFREYANGLGLDGDALIDCLDSGKYRQVVLSSQMRARQLGLSGTPTFIINGRRVGSAMSFDQMSAIIEEELAKQ
jgi:protein-disulfide isomerase